MAVAATTRLTAKQGRKFAFTLGVAFLVLGGISYWRGHVIPPVVLFILAGLLILSGLLVPTRLGPIERGWMAFGHFLSKIMSPIILGVIYFAVVTPVGFLMRLFGKMPMTEHHQKDTTWKTRTKRHSDLTRQF